MTNELSTPRVSFIPLVLIGLAVLFSGCAFPNTDVSQNTDITADANIQVDREEIIEEQTVVQEDTDTMTAEETNIPVINVETNSGVNVTVDVVPVAPIRVIKVGSKNFSFFVDGKENPDIVVKEGEKVRIDFSSEGGFHDWVVSEFNATTKQIQTGGTSSVEFVASKKGTFEYYCSVGSHREMGMKGKLIVE